MNKTVLVTGASSGFEKETAKLFQLRGWNIIGSMRSITNETELSNLDNVLIVELDVQKANSIKNAVELGLDRFGKIDVLLNNAGYAVMGIFEQTTEEQIKDQLDVNIFGMMRVQTVFTSDARKRDRFDYKYIICYRTGWIAFCSLL